MKISIFGAGYVGLVTGVCLAEIGHHVTVIDVDEAKIHSIDGGVVPFFEPGLAELLTANQTAGRFVATTDTASVLSNAEIVVIAVGTPTNHDGSPNLEYVESVATIIGNTLDHQVTVIVKSTVPVGTGDQLEALINDTLSKRAIGFTCDVVSNPEFLREGNAVGDFMVPDRIVIGGSSPEALETVRSIYQRFEDEGRTILVMDRHSSELTKYAANAMLATRISFINEIAQLAEAVGADIEHVAKGIGTDPRIGSLFLRAGAGYGGSCFPKDVDGLISMATQSGLNASLMRAVDAVNGQQSQLLVDKITRALDSDLTNKTIAIWGLAFKPDTDDLREAVSLKLISHLSHAGATVKAFDPVAMDAAAKAGIGLVNVTLASSKEEAVQGADLLVLVTEWAEFQDPDFENIQTLMNAPIIVDARNLWDPAALKALGFSYTGIGRGV